MPVVSGSGPQRPSVIRPDGRDARDDGVVDGRCGRDQFPDDLDSFRKIPDDIERDDRHAPAIALD